MERRLWEGGEKGGWEGKGRREGRVKEGLGRDEGKDEWDCETKV